MTTTSYVATDQLNRRPAPSRVRLEEALEIAVDSYVYAYPLVSMEMTRRAAITTTRGAAINQFCHVRTFPDANTAHLGRSCYGALESSLWLDLSHEPVVVTVPDSSGRYFQLPILDMWSNVFASPGARTSGTRAQQLVILGPDWRGPLPKRLEFIQSPTSHAWMIGSILTDGPDDYADAHAFQSALRAQPLSRWNASSQVEADDLGPITPTPPIPMQVARMSGAKFFSLFLESTRLNSPHIEDNPIISRMRRINLAPGTSLNLDSLPLTVKAALRDAPKKALQHIADAGLRSGSVRNGWSVWFNPMGTYGTDYAKRAGVAHLGLGANTIEDVLTATLDERSCRHPLDSGRWYRLHFQPHQIPPANAFWSITMYNDRKLLAKNVIDRYALSSRDKIAFNEDGSLDLYLQRESPGSEREANWLPTPTRGSFSLGLRIHWPKPAALDGSWAPPPIVRFR